MALYRVVRSTLHQTAASSYVKYGERSVTVVVASNLRSLPLVGFCLQ